MFLGTRFNPSKDYEYIAQSRHIKPLLFLQIILTSLIPIICGYIGFSTIGVITPAGSIYQLGTETIIYFSVFLAISYLTSILLAGWFIFNTRHIFNAQISATASFLFAYYCSIPFIVASISFIIPYAIFNTVALLCAILYSVKVLYTGLYKISNIEPEAGFAYSSLILTGIMIGFVGWIASITIIYVHFPELLIIL